ncbi:sigma-54 dependent transcriptional regulator [Alkalihalobacillus sp. MEB130]|uniref:sigma-54-dependent transcriptional regulator n=1 Tax=Alkalihalobacillus sp. MEB130 TaxID=2976704 RepID=UPI0028DF68B5|nr:sigma-54 dependent transcriptional regulator [Alkalihalobacillus sp. MEB130]MDT8861653.1 sigma-54 dependent transcriptional regulator [Alkalihalobacillus sp. MEB130]
MPKIIIIDDEIEVGNFLEHLLTNKGYDVYVGHNGAQCQQLLDTRSYQLALLDVKLPDTSGLSLLAKIKSSQPQCKTIIMTGYSTVKTAVDAIKIGANDYIEKPFDDIDILEQLIDQLLYDTVTTEQSSMRELAERSGLVFGESHSMMHVVTMAYKIANKNVNVLIEGETGTGKEVLSEYIHLASKRKEQPFVAVNCGAISEALLESELFGHVKGAFTGAIKEKKGIFEIASNGTLFLDEVAEASLSTQVKLLRVLETGEYMKVGDETVRKTNTRIIAASHVNLAKAVEEKKFREDLLYRLDVVKLTIPPLRERIEDIPLLLSYLLNKQCPTLTFSEESKSLLAHYHWPGNIRELSNVIKRAVALADEEVATITPEFLPDKLQKQDCIVKSENMQPDNLMEESFEEYVNKWTKQLLVLWKTENDVNLEVVLQQIKDLETVVGKSFVKKVLKDTIGDRKIAAERLNISMRKLRYLLNEKGS